MNVSTIADYITRAVAGAAPGLIADKLTEASLEIEDPLGSSVVLIMAQRLREDGPDAIVAFGDSLASVIEGGQRNPSAVLGLGLSASDLTELTDQLQSAEAAAIERAAAAARVIGVLARQLIERIVAAGLQAG